MSAVDEHRYAALFEQCNNLLDWENNSGWASDVIYHCKGCSRCNCQPDGIDHFLWICNRKGNLGVDNRSSAKSCNIDHRLTNRAIGMADGQQFFARFKRGKERSEHGIRTLRRILYEYQVFHTCADEQCKLCL